MMEPFTRDESADIAPLQEPVHSYPVLCPWEMGEAVADLQELLCAHGYEVRVDQDFGWKTEAAVRAFQADSGLRIDGVVGSQTWYVLTKMVKPGARSLRLGHRGMDVYELQGLLQVMGFNLRRSGYFDPATEEAVKQFQRSHHLRDDGIVHPITWTLLRAGQPIDPPSAPRRKWFKSIPRRSR
ncbi:peptidoglycan-binding domain-containing protein [Leptolyngbya sp. AN02str]|uniref:peptidoglycan-binding domain-containing protein n=1 Tax=Leptolyngbya sp. AN02str TaxID=3423363 RepID=UPI003D31AC45